MDIGSSPPHISQLDSSAPSSQEAPEGDAELSRSEAERLAREETSTHGLADTFLKKLKPPLHLATGRLIDRLTTSPHLSNTNATPQFIGALTELVWNQISNVAVDVEAFARHAGRTVVEPEDVLLLARKNDALEGLLKKHAASLDTTNAETQGNSRSSASARGKGSGGKGRGASRKK